MTTPLQSSLDEELKAAAERVLEKLNSPAPRLIMFGERQVYPETGEERRFALGRIVGHGIYEAVAMESAFYLHDPPTVIVREMR